MRGCHGQTKFARAEMAREMARASWRLPMAPKQMPPTLEKLRGVQSSTGPFTRICHPWGEPVAFDLGRSLRKEGDVVRNQLAAFVIGMAVASTAAAQQPGWGTEPTQPGWGTQPTQPTQPGWGTEPVQPVQPTPPPPTVVAPPAPTLEGGNIALGFSNHFAPMFNTGNALGLVIAEVDAPPGDVSAAVGNAASYYANLSLRYRFSLKHEIEVFLGMAYLNMTHSPYDDPLDDPIHPEEVSMDGFLMHLGGRYLFTIAGNERARLYTGAGLGFMVATAGGDEDDADHTHGSMSWLGWGITIGAPLGFEYRFEAAPQLALTMEVGLGLAYVSGALTATPPTGSGATETEDSGGQFLFGIGQSANFDPRDTVYLPVIDHLSFGPHYWF